MSQKMPKNFNEMTRDEKKKYIKDNYERMREEDNRPVRGKFIFHEAPGALLAFPYHKYKGDEVKYYHLLDGHIYTIPLGVAKHLNSNCSYPEYGYITTEKDSDIVAGNNPDSGYRMRVTRKVRRTSFQSLEFLEEDLGQQSDLVTVERMI